jgi:ketosteroid isomerase-like protein
LSQENVEAARRAYEAFNNVFAKGDFSGWLALYTPDAELHDPGDFPDAGVHRGHDELRKWAEQLNEVAEDLRVEHEHFIEAGELVVVTVRITAKGREGGVPTEMSTFHVLEFTDGKICRGRFYLTEDEALEAAGLRE